MPRLRRLAALVLIVATVMVLAVGAPLGATVHAKKKISCPLLLKPTEIEKIVGATVTAQKPFATTGQIGCNWTNDADEVDVSVFIARRDDQYTFSKEHLPADYTIEPVTGIGQDAFIVRSPTGGPVVIWVLAKRASFSLANINVDKDDATVETEITTLATKVAKRLK